LSFDNEPFGNNSTTTPAAPPSATTTTTVSPTSMMFPQSMDSFNSTSTTSSSSNNVKDQFDFSTLHNANSVPVQQQPTSPRTATAGEIPFLQPPPPRKIVPANSALERQFTASSKMVTPKDIAMREANTKKESLSFDNEPFGNNSTTTPAAPPSAISTGDNNSKREHIVALPKISKNDICPVCSRSFKLKSDNATINAHVDRCLNGRGKDDKCLEEEEKKVTAPPAASSPAAEPWKEWFDLSKMDWYYGNIDRTEAERVLFACTTDSFLVRKSNSVKDAFALSLYNRKKQTVNHTLIEPRNNGGYAFQDSQKVYTSVLDLITKSPECSGLSPPPKVTVALDHILL